MLEALLPLLRGRAEVDVHDIDSNPDWRRQFDRRVPVLEFTGELVCQFQLDTAAVTAVLTRIAENPAEHRC
ncbi:MAG: glutaredoxin family protein [Gammaproteobacteria bacterium]|nr:glutaredoxin family protein [Gammaproteobacteria bacterium]